MQGDGTVLIGVSGGDCLDGTGFPCFMYRDWIVSANLSGRNCLGQCRGGDYIDQ